MRNAQTLPTIALSLSAATDVIIALALSYYLHTMRTGHETSERLIDRLILFRYLSLVQRTETGLTVFEASIPEHSRQRSVSPS